MTCAKGTVVKARDRFEREKKNVIDGISDRQDSFDCMRFGEAANENATVRLKTRRLSGVGPSERAESRKTIETCCLRAVPRLSTNDNYPSSVRPSVCLSLCPFASVLSPVFLHQSSISDNDTQLPSTGGQSTHASKNAILSSALSRVHSDFGTRRRLTCHLQ